MDKKLAGYLFYIDITEDGKLVLRDTEFIHLDYEDELFFHKDGSPEPKKPSWPSGRMIAKAQAHARRIGPTSEGFYIRPVVTSNRQFVPVSIVVENEKRNPKPAVAAKAPATKSKSTQSKNTKAHGTEANAKVGKSTKHAGQSGSKKKAATKSTARRSTGTTRKPAKKSAGAASRTKRK